MLIVLKVASETSSVVAAQLDISASTSHELHASTTHDKNIGACPSPGASPTSSSASAHPSQQP